MPTLLSRGCILIAMVRYGAMYGLALAHCGTGSNKAMRILLLHTAASDVGNDVSSLLLESFDPHVRYASCIIAHFAMAGSGDAESVALLGPMLTDMADHVRQGADRVRSWERP